MVEADSSSTFLISYVPLCFHLISDHFKILYLTHTWHCMDTIINYLHLLILVQDLLLAVDLTECWAILKKIIQCIHSRTSNWVFYFWKISMLRTWTTASPALRIDTIRLVKINNKHSNTGCCSVLFFSSFLPPFFII